MNRSMGHQQSFLADQRGAVAFEMPVVFLFLMVSLLFPLADLTVTGVHYLSALQALRAFGQAIQYATPPDVTSASSWTSSALAKADPAFPVANFQLICGDTKSLCSTTNTASPKYYSFTTSITLSPMLLKSVLCTSGNTNPCTFTLHYSERFQ